LRVKVVEARDAKARMHGTERLWSKPGFGNRLRASLQNCLPCRTRVRVGIGRTSPRQTQRLARMVCHPGEGLRAAGIDTDEQPGPKERTGHDTSL
jgi:hypothetical protein